ncbi:pectate lyase superfamily protein-domain-containing protein [Xylariomycetidae sp. FL0641]|nr:pectate lyase superfamily protein-domain-containing protein [Xylariomycetidae sp. FL0641]
MRFQTFLTALISLALGANAAYWLEDIKHQGVAPFGGDGYKVFRNVKDYGAVGDGTTDDTEAIMAAMNDGQNRCLQGCASTTQTPAIVYFPAGTYLISSSIVPPYFTQMIGDAVNPPTLKASSGFAGFGLIDGNPYYTENLNWVSTNVFYRQVKNFILDTTAIPPATAATGMHWPTSQATSLINIVFNMPTDPSCVHVGLFVENGSGGFMSDLTFNGGATGASLGNQQYTTRHLVFNNCQTAVITLWNWGWTFIDMEVNSCGVALDMSAGGSSDIETGSAIVMDSKWTDTPIGVKTVYTSSSNPDTAGSLIIENLSLSNVPTAVQGPDGATVLEGGSTTIAGWAQGNSYTPGPSALQGPITPNTRPGVLTTDGGHYYSRSKPSYADLTASDFISVRDAGAKGDGVTDDTAALQSAIDSAGSSKVVFLDFGLYKVTDTINIPDGTRIIGECYPVIMASGAKFGDMNNPKVMLKVGATSGAVGTVEMSDFVVATKGAAPGATLIEWNLASSGAPSGMWEVHARVGGFAGSDLQVAQCLKTPGSPTVNEACIGAYMLMHVTPKASNLYMENTWMWTADHDIEDATNTQVTIYVGRGLYIESTVGTFWLYATAVEHNALYNYQFANTKNIMVSMFQTETPYYQPIPDATVPFPPVAALNDPDFTASCAGIEGNCADAWGLRIIDSTDFFVYGAGHYSFFNNYSTDCSTVEAGENCQSRIVSIEGSTSNINIYALSTIGSLSMVDKDGKSLASWSDNVNVFNANIILFRTG